MAWNTARVLLPHYLILVSVIVAVLVTMRRLVPGVNIWFQIAVAMLVGTVYPLVLRYFGVAPEPWQ